MEVSNGLSFTDGVKKVVLSGWIELLTPVFQGISNCHIVLVVDSGTDLRNYASTAGNQKIFSFEYYNTDNYVTIENPGGTGNFPSLQS